MKKAFALLLCLVMILCAVPSCAKTADDDKGATLNVYMASELFSFDPATAYVDDAATQILGLIYEPLFTFDQNGKRVNGCCKSTRIVDDEDKGIHYIEFNLYDTCWSDGIALQASHFVYAFKRIMEPESHSEAVPLLMELKNAEEVRSGDATIDDLGVYDVGTGTLRCEFDHKIDYERFMDYMASPLLVPLREDAIRKVVNWSTNATIVVTNGPFTLRSFDYGVQMTLERNAYYRRDIERDGVKKYVTPYRIVFHYDTAPEDAVNQLAESTVLVDGKYPLTARTTTEMKTIDTMTEMALVFNTNKETYASADVRYALSLALDRNKIASTIGGTPATGLITKGVWETNRSGKTMFADVSGEVIPAAGDASQAKSLLGGKSGSITVTYKANPEDEAVFQYVKGVWEGMGFSVKGDPIGFNSNNKDIVNDYDIYNDVFLDRYQSGSFDVIMIDYQMLTTDAFPNLAHFALKFAGGAMDLSVTSDEFELVPHISGYNSEAYNKLIDDAFAETDPAKRAEILHNAEKTLLRDAPIAPLAVYKTGYNTSKELTGLKTDAFGSLLFKKSSRKGYYEKEAAEAAAAEAQG